MRRVLVLLALVAGLASCSAAAPPPPRVTAAEFAWLNRLTWGATPADVADYRRLGRDGWLAANLAPTPRPLPAAVAARLDAQPLVDGPIGAKIVDLELRRRAAVHAVDPEERTRLYAAYRDSWASLRDQALDRSLSRDLASPDQLREQLTWFWFNQFNVHGRSNNLAVLIGDYEENAIRAHATGKFCDLVLATLRHPAMLIYLNNAANRAGAINENYARELMELHTLGVGTGYTQADVQALARVLTGATVDLTHWPAPAAPPGGVRDGVFVFDPALHDTSPKTLLGHRLRQHGYAEIEEAVGLLCAHPATAKRVAVRLAEYFVTDAPPETMVEAMAATFTRTGGDIAAVVRTMVDTPAFAASLGTLYKDPNHFVLSALRLSLAGEAPAAGRPAAALLDRLGQGRFARLTPDGYPLTSENWNASGQLATRFQLAAQLGKSGGGMLDLDLLKRPTGGPPDLAAFQAAGFYGALSPATATVLAETRGAAEWNGLFLASPEFMRR